MNRFSFASFLALALLLASCGKDKSPAGASAEATSSPAALPVSWLGGESADASLPQPTAEATESVRAAFVAHTAAMEQLSARENAAPTSFSAGQPADWVPWHLDGLIGAFAVDIGGIFGALFADASPGVKITWQKQSAQKTAVHVARTSAVRLQPYMTTADVATLVEPAIRTAIASGSVRDESAMRRTLNAEGAKFLSLVRVLSTVSAGQGWHIDGYQLSLSVTAAGMVAPAVTVGGTFSVIFDWQAVPGQAVTVQLNDGERGLQAQASSVARTLAAILPEARVRAGELRQAGFEFQVFQLGIGITIGGDLGIITAQGFAGGRVIFKKNGVSGLVTAFDRVTEGATLPLLVPSEAPSGLPGAVAAVAPRTVVNVPADKIRNGLARAMRMGAFFARQAVAAESTSWKTTEIELGLDVNVGGQLTLVTVAGQGLTRLGFERVE